MPTYLNQDHTPSLASLVAGVLLMTALPARPAPWGTLGHEMIGRAAAEQLPEAMPVFFKEAVDQLAYLNAEPDRWKDPIEQAIYPALGGNYSPGHYINLEVVPPEALAAPDRLAYFNALEQAGVERMPGYLPFVMLELSQRIRVGFREWRRADARERPWIEDRIINDAGILGHYVADASNPLHTTIHHNGWLGANPNGYATGDDTHERIETDYVRSRITSSEIVRLMGSPMAFDDLRVALWTYLAASNDLVEELYRVDRESRFDDGTTAAENQAFIAARMAVGAAMLRDLWWSCWLSSQSDG